MCKYVFQVCQVSDSGHQIFSMVAQSLSDGYKTTGMKVRFSHYDGLTPFSGRAEDRQNCSKRGDEEKEHEGRRGERANNEDRREGERHVLCKDNKLGDRGRRNVLPPEVLRGWRKTLQTELKSARSKLESQKQERGPKPDGELA